MADDAKTTAMFLRPLADLLGSQGQDASAIFADYGIELADTHNAESLTDVACSTALLSAVETMLEDPSLGINMALRTEYSAFGGLGLALSAGGTVLSVLKRIVRYHRLISNVVHTELQDSESHVTIKFYKAMQHEPHPQAMQHVMACIVRLLRFRVDRNINPLAVYTRHNDPDYLQRMARYFRVTPQLSDHYAIVFGRDVVNTTLSSSEPQLAAMIESTLSQRLAEQLKGSLEIQLTSWLETKLPEGEPSLADAAQLFHISSRSLQRRLASESLTWNQILENTRRNLAERYLQDPGMSVTQLTFLLGYSDLSSFSRAFRKWFGVAPSQYGISRSVD